MYSKNKTNLKDQLAWLIDYWVSKQENYEELNFFYEQEFHGKEFIDHLRRKLLDKIFELERIQKKEEFKRKRYARDGFYASEAYNEQKEKLKSDDRYKVHKVNF